MKLEDIRALYHGVVKELGVDHRDVIVTGGAAMVMLGIREETNDLDLDVTQEIFDKYKTDDNIEYFGDIVVINYNDLVSFHVLDPNATAIETKDGITRYAIEKLIKQKQDLINNPDRDPLSRLRDIEDLKVLRERLGMRSSAFRW
jgi:hypothetical protein